jgi:transcriptional regulator with XRE-family HTH domain
MARTFRSAFSHALARDGLSLDAIAAGTSIARPTLERVLAEPDAMLSLRDAETIAEFLGSSLAEFLEAPEQSDPIEIARLYSQLPEPLKDRFQACRPEPPAPSDPSDPESP